MATQRYGRTQNQVFVAKIEGTEGTAESLTTATDSMPVQPVTVDLGEQTITSNEAQASIIVGQTTVTRFDPRANVVATMRGSGSVATAPRISPLIRVSGFAEQTLAVLPSSSTFTAASGTTKTIVVDRSSGTGTQLAATNALLAAQLVGRVMTLSTNPSTPRDVVIVKATVSGNNVTITFGETLAAAADNTTTAVVKAGTLYQPTTTVPTLTANIYRDGKMIALIGCRAKASFALPGSEPPTWTADLGGTFSAESDASVPSDADFSSLPAEPIWRNGRAWIDYLETGCSNLSIDMQTQSTKYLNPNLTYGVDREILTQQNPGGTLNLNDKLVAYHDVVTKLAANTLMPFVAVTDMSGSAGSRLAVAIPNLKILKAGGGDREGIIESALNFQAAFVSPTPAVTFFFY